MREAYGVDADVASRRFAVSRFRGFAFPKHRSIVRERPFREPTRSPRAGCRSRRGPPGSRPLPRGHTRRAWRGKTAAVPPDGRSPRVAVPPKRRLVFSPTSTDRQLPSAPTLALATEKIVSRDAACRSVPTGPALAIAHKAHAPRLHRVRRQPCFARRRPRLPHQATQTET